MMAWDTDEDEDDTQALLPALVQIVPISVLAILGGVVLPLLLKPLAVVALAVLVVVSEPPDKDEED